MALQSDTVILNGKYRIRKLLAEGGMAHIWLAEELTFGGRQVVIKEPRSDLLPHLAQEVQERYHREVQVCAALVQAGAPHIVKALTAEPDGDGLLLVLEYMPGGDLDARLKQHPRGLPIDQAVTIAREVLTALDGLHNHPRELIHRDVKPSNILFDAPGRAHLGDLGLVEMPGMSGRSQLRGGQHPGTPLYMAPEQARSPDPLTPAADLYALGCVLFEMLTGQRAKRVKPGTTARSLRPDVPPWLDEALARARQEDPWDRYPSAAEMAAALDQGYREAARQAQAQREAEARARREAERRERDLRLTLAPGVILELAPVPAGEFLMGSSEQDKEAWPDERPQHRVHLDEYRIGKYPVTVAQFAAFVKATGYRTTIEQQGSGYTWIGSEWKEVKGANWQHPRGPQSDVKQKTNHPVALVSWDDAAAFCQWASQVTGRAVRLPTEAEWERAARGTDGRLWPWGNEAPDKTRCNFDMNVKDTTPVGQYSPRGDSPTDCADIAGNVWEWTSSLFRDYPYRSDDGREDPGDRAARVLRGGSFNHDRGHVRCACRIRSGPYPRGADGGFRVGAAPIYL